jgi:hypothetical protein
VGSRQVCVHLTFVAAEYFLPTSETTERNLCRFFVTAIFGVQHQLWGFFFLAQIDGINCKEGVVGLLRPIR